MIEHSNSLVLEIDQILAADDIFCSVRTIVFFYFDTQVEAGRMELEAAPFSITDELEALVDIYAVQSARSNIDVVLDLSGRMNFRSSINRSMDSCLFFRAVRTRCQFFPPRNHQCIRKVCSTKFLTVNLLQNWTIDSNGFFS